MRILVVPDLHGRTNWHQLVTDFLTAAAYAAIAAPAMSPGVEAPILA